MPVIFIKPRTISLPATVQLLHLGSKECPLLLLENKHDKDDKIFKDILYCIANLTTKLMGFNLD